MKIHNFQSMNEPGHPWQDQIRHIFFLSSSRTEFATPLEKDAFYHRWTEYYFTHCERFIYLAVEDNRLLGYLMGCSDSRAAEEHYAQTIKSYAVFADLFERFPAHLHINCHPSARGRGVGSRLVEKFIEDLRTQGVGGVHLVTSPDSPNRAFYRKNNFQEEVIRPFKDVSLLFMGRFISA